LTAVSLGEPGFEDRELLQTDFRLLPKWFDRIALNSFPVIDNQSQVNFVLNKHLDFNPTLPIGALTKESAG
jgi:dihydroorotase